MLTRLRFKNWRSLKDVEIADLTPITVFIGANSSGKTNIINAMRFLQLMLEKNSPKVVYRQVNREKIRTLGVDDNEPIEIEVDVQPNSSEDCLTYLLGIETENAQPHFIERGFDSANRLSLDAKDGRARVGVIFDPDSEVRLLLSRLARIANLRGAFDDSLQKDIQMSSFIFKFITERWQVLEENFLPLLRLLSQEFGDAYKIGPHAQNVMLILDFMQEQYPSIYTSLNDDLSWLVEHVHKLETVNLGDEIELSVREKTRPNLGAPTISAGTARLLAILTAYYALDMHNAEMPGLVVIEEPDTALNPGIHRNFVEQLRNYTSREGYPRQFILTTHNPHFLDFFQPEEVRVVERDEQGYTQVKKIDDSIRAIWLDKYGLGEVWTTNSFGGLPK